MTSPKIKLFTHWEESFSIITSQAKAPMIYCLVSQMAFASLFLLTWALISRGFLTQIDLIFFSGSLAFLYLCMRTFQAYLCKSTWNSIEEKETKLSFSYLSKSFLKIASLEIFFLTLLPLAIFFIFPLPWLLTYHKHLLIHMGSFHNLKDIKVKALKTSKRLFFSDILLFLTFLPLLFSIFLILFIFTSILPTLVRMLFGIQTFLDLSWDHVFNSTFLVISIMMTWILIAPLNLVSETLRVFDSTAQTNGQDLMSIWRKLF